MNRSCRPFSGNSTVAFTRSRGSRGMRWSALSLASTLALGGVALGCGEDGQCTGDNCSSSTGTSGTAGAGGIVSVCGASLLTCDIPALGNLTREVWSNVAGRTIATIPVATTPTSVGSVYSFQAPSSAGDNYGQRIRGYILAPTTGAYTFWNAGDDVAELWLGSSEEATTKQCIAYTTQLTGGTEWNKFATQKSAPINLVAGNLYYVEGLMKENVGGDTLAVGWLKPGEAGTEPSEIIPSTVLSPFPYTSQQFVPQAFVPYYLRPQVSGLALTSATGALPAALTEQAKNGRLPQIFSLSTVGDGEYRISVGLTGGVLSATGAAPGSVVKTQIASGQTSTWRIEPWSSEHLGLMPRPMWSATPSTHGWTRSPPSSTPTAA
jgi:hypothetical protein